MTWFKSKNINKIQNVTIVATSSVKDVSASAENKNSTTTQENSVQKEDKTTQVEIFSSGFRPLFKIKESVVDIKIPLVVC